MRIAPATTFSALGNFIAQGAGGGSIALTALTLSAAATDAVWFSLTVAAGLVAGNQSNFFANAPAWMQFDARM
jgi:hypothetical protein